MNRHAVTIVGFLMAASAAWSQASTQPYAQIVVDEILLRNAKVSMLSIRVQDPTGKDIVVASKNARLRDGRIGENDPKIFAGEQMMTRLDAAKHRCQALVPLPDISQKVIGTLRVDVTIDGNSQSGCRREAEELRDELSQVIPSSQELFDPYIVSTSSSDTLAQRLTIETLAKHPELLVLAFHVTAPGENVNRVVGINRQKFLGRASDEVDQEVAKTGKTIVQIIPATHRMEIHMPLRTSAGSLAGTLVTVSLWRSEAETPELMSRSMQIRDELQPRIPNLAALVSRVQ